MGAPTRTAGPARQGAAVAHARQERSRGRSRRRARQAGPRADAARARWIAEEPARAREARLRPRFQPQPSRSPATTPPTTTSPAYLELIGKRFTGSGCHGLMLAQDKSVAKKIFAFHGISTPVFARSFRGRLDFSHDLHFPVIVKPTREDGSIGIEFNAVVSSIRELMERIDWLHAHFDSPSPHRGIRRGPRDVRRRDRQRQPRGPARLSSSTLSKLPEGTPRIAAAEVKWGKGTKAYRDTKSALATDLPEETGPAAVRRPWLRIRRSNCGTTAASTCACRPDGRVQVIEVNPNPWLASTAEFAMAARKAGRTYTQLIGEIVELAMGRYLEMSREQREAKEPRDRLRIRRSDHPPGAVGSLEGRGDHHVRHGELLQRRGASGGAHRARRRESSCVSCIRIGLRSTSARASCSWSKPACDSHGAQRFFRPRIRPIPFAFFDSRGPAAVPEEGWRTDGQDLVASLVLVYWVLSTPIAAVALVHLLSPVVHPILSVADAGGATAIVVLGAGMQVHRSRGAAYGAPKREGSLRALQDRPIASAAGRRADHRDRRRQIRALLRVGSDGASDSSSWACLRTKSSKKRSRPTPGITRCLCHPY